MKNATEYGNKVQKALPELVKRLTPAAHPEGLDTLDCFILAVLRQDTPLAKAVESLEILKREFVDLNELRVAPPRDIVELLDPVIPDRRGKALQITTGLNRIFDHGNRLDFEHATELGKRELRSHLHDSLGFNSYVEAYMMLNVFEARAIAVDDKLTARLKQDDLVHEEADNEDVRSMLERVISAKDAVEAFAVLSAFAHEAIEEPEPEVPEEKPKAKPAARKAKTAKKAKDAKKAKKAAGSASSDTAKKTAKKPKTAKKSSSGAKTAKKSKTAKSAKKTKGKQDS